MHTKLLAASAIVLSTLAVSSCATSRPEPLPEPLALPVRAEPQFQRTNYAALPAGTEMVVRLDTSDLIAKLKSQFDTTLSSKRSGFSLLQEELIISNGKPYRRVWVHHEDSATWSMHGACGQNIYAWFPATGELAEVFVEPLMCPI